MLIAAMCATSCDTFDDLLGGKPQPAPDAEYYTVSLGFDGEIEVGYEPLLLAAENNDLYGIQVYSAPAVTTGESVKWARYAYGLFDNTDNITIDLLVGYQYKFEATMVKDGKEKVWGDDVYGYHRPFYAASGAPVSESFTYGLEGFGGLGSGCSYLKNPNGYFDHPNTERYYGELEGYLPGENGAKAKIHMKRTSFGAKYIAKGEMSGSGTLEILMSSAPRLELNLAEGKQVSEIYTFENVRGAWLDNDYSEDIDVVLNYIRTDNTVLPLGAHKLTFKRNATTVVNVKIGVGAESNGVGFEFEEAGDLAEDPTLEKTIENGEDVDTEVETNK